MGSTLDASGLYVSNLHKENSFEAIRHSQKYGKVIKECGESDHIDSNWLGGLQSMGPQCTLYIPSPLLRLGENRLVSMNCEVTYISLT